MKTLRGALEESERERFAIGHFNVSDLVMLKAVAAAAHEMNGPLLVGVSEGEREFIGVRQIAALVRSIREENALAVFLNADHTHSLAKAVEAAAAGFDAIAFDRSGLPFEENVGETKRAVEAIKSIDPAIIVEGEIGDIGSGSEIHENSPASAGILTTPEEARQFVAETSVDVLAPAVGNMHGLLPSMARGESHKHLDIGRISAIKGASHIYMTLHGGSGTQEDDLKEAVAAGINIIHINTELRLAWRRSIESGLADHPNEVAPYRILTSAVTAVKEVVTSRLILFRLTRQEVVR
jgi:fructose-bisphosphate aldolase class II